MVPDLVSGGEVSGAVLVGGVSCLVMAGSGLALDFRVVRFLVGLSSSMLDPFLGARTRRTPSDIGRLANRVTSAGPMEEKLCKARVASSDTPYALSCGD